MTTVVAYTIIIISLNFLHNNYDEQLFLCDVSSAVWVRLLVGVDQLVIIEFLMIETQSSADGFLL